MLRITWPGDGQHIRLFANCSGEYLMAGTWTIPHGVDVYSYIAEHTYPETDVQAGSLEISDENSIEWWPVMDGDCFCYQEAISGVLTADMSLEASLHDARYRNSGYGRVMYFDDMMSDVQIIGQTYFDGWTTWHWEGSFPHYTRFYTNPYGYRGETHVYLEPTPGGYFRTQTGSDPYPRTFISWGAVSMFNFEGFVPSQVSERYTTMCAYIRRQAHIIWDNLRFDVHHWEASLDAVQGFHPYDLNLVESVAQFSMEDIVPKGTSSSILSILTDAVNSRGGLLSPSGIVYAAQIFANSYLYYKYVALGNYSDVTEILIGDDKATLSEIVTRIHAIDPNYVPDQENWRLKRVAEILVHRGSKLLSSYGFYGDQSGSVLGETRYQCRARLRAYPRYYDDMSAAAIVCEEFGLSLTAERLAAIIPYEFIAEWFLPIEETIRSIEYNSSRLQMLYKVQGLCISDKLMIDLDMNYLKAMFGLSDLTGSLNFKIYQRSTRDEFPPTTPDLNLRPKVSLSKVMQGASLILTRM